MQGQYKIIVIKIIQLNWLSLKILISKIKNHIFNKILIQKTSFYNGQFSF